MKYVHKPNFVSLIFVSCASIIIILSFGIINDPGGCGSGHNESTGINEEFASDEELSEGSPGLEETIEGPPETADLPNDASEPAETAEPSQEPEQPKEDESPANNESGQTSNCTDTDDQEAQPLMTGGKITYIDLSDGREYEYWDACKNDSEDEIIENTCDGDNLKQEELTEHGSQSTAFYYFAECSAGYRCIDRDESDNVIPAYCKSYAEEEETERYRCKDTDGGKNPTVAGIVQVWDNTTDTIVMSFKDKCENDRMNGFPAIAEYWCNKAAGNSTADLVHETIFVCTDLCNPDKNACSVPQ